MSNGIGKNPLDDISKVYLETVAKEGYDKPDEKLKTDRNMFNIPKDEQKAARERLLKKTAAKRAAAMEALDPVGKEDGDVNNDGKKDSTDSYLMKRRKAIGAAMKKKMKEQAEIARAEAKAIEEEENKVAEEIEQKKFEAVKAKLAKEGKSNWRDDLSDLIEVAPMTDTESEKKIKEKKVENRIKINPKLGEAVEEIGGEIIEMTEVEEEKKPLPKTKMFRKAGNLGRDAISTPIDPEKRQKAYDRSKKIIKTLNQNEEVEVDEAMSSYDRNRKRAAQRAAERNAARAAGKTGVVPGVGYVSPRKERETYVDSAGTTRHKSGAKMEEVEVAEADDPKSDAMLAKKKQMLQKQYMLDKMRMQMQKQGKLPMGSQRSGSAMESTESNIDEKINPLLKGILKKTPKGEDPEKGGVPYKRTGKMTEGLSVDDQMKISRDAAKGRNPNPDHKAIRGKMLRKPLPKDTRTDAQKMTDATGPRPGSRYRGD